MQIRFLNFIYYFFNIKMNKYKSTFGSIMFKITNTAQLWKLNYLQILLYLLFNHIKFF